jgi:hypothetical protein
LRETTSKSIDILPCNEFFKTWWCWQQKQWRNVLKNSLHGRIWFDFRKGFSNSTRQIPGNSNIRKLNFWMNFVVFWNLLIISGLSQICKIRNTLIPSFEKTSWSLLESFWKKYCPINSKTGTLYTLKIIMPMVKGMLEWIRSYKKHTDENRAEKCEK